MPTAKKTISAKKKKIIDKKPTEKPTEKPIKKPIKKPAKYHETIGRRKTAVARVRLSHQGEKAFTVNQKPYQKYFPTQELQKIVIAPLETMNANERFKISVLVKGGGFHAQAEAVRHGLARALTLFNATFRKRLKKAGYLSRDSRMRERKKFGLKRARRAPQWRKR